MATESNITGWWVLEDKRVSFTVGTNITSWNLEFAVFDGAGNTVLSKTTPTSGVSITAATSGVAEAYVTSTDTSSMIPRVYQYWFRRTDTGTVTVLSYGNLTLNPRS